MNDRVTAKARYDALSKERQPFLDRARLCSAYTLPMLIPRDGHESNSSPPTPFSSTAAQGVNALAAKLLLALFPPNSPFFRLALDRQIAQQAEAEQAPSGQTMRQLLEAVLSQTELTAVEEIEKSSLRPKLNEAFRHIIVGGNVCLEEDGRNTRVYSLDRYVVRRNGYDAVIELIIHEKVEEKDLSENQQNQIKDPNLAGKKSDGKDIDLFTHYILKGKKWESYQEAAGVKLEGTEASYTEEDFPCVILRWNRIDGEHYGRGYVEEYLGDVISLEELRKAEVQGAAAAARILFLVEPGGSTQLEDLEKAQNGDFVSGRKEEVNCLQLDKYADLRIASEATARIEQALRSAFLMVASIQRNAERVTAEEIRLMASELENVLGGIYSLLSQELQYPLIRRILSRLRRSKLIPDLPADSVNVSIVTGLEALGRGQDLQRLDTAIFGIPEAILPEAMRYLKVAEYLSRRFKALGIDTQSLIKSEAEVAQEMQNAQMQQMTEKLGPTAIKEAGAAGAFGGAQQ